MKTHNPDNERIKRKYARWLQEAEGYSEASVDQALAAIHRFEADTGYRSFKSFHIEAAIAFKRRLSGAKSEVTGKLLSKASLQAILNANRKFVHWLAGQPTYRRRISYGDSEYFRLSDNDTRIARAKREKHVPTIEQIRRVLQAMPSDTDIQKRDRALIAFTILTSARDGEIISIRLKHIDLAARRIVRNPSEMKVKRGKSFLTVFFPVGDDIQSIVEDWVRYLETELLLGPDDPIFPATKIGLDANRKFSVVGLDRKPWANAQPVRKIFRAAFEAVGLPPSNPHSFRDTIARLGEQRCKTPEEFKAWSQNMGHERVMTTFTSYGSVPEHRQAELIAALGQDSEAEAADERAPDAATVQRVLDHLKQMAS